MKNAQEAHEAIRPAGDTFRMPADVQRELSRDEHDLYELIWKRTVASQMEDARGQTASLRLGATASDGRDAEFGASGTVITFRGFLAAYEEGRDDESKNGDDERRLPQLEVGQAVDASSLEPDGHSTSPPARYTEASLVKALEERGIGRPSTYASIMGTILDRGYVFKKGTALVPTFLAFSVTQLLERHFERLVDYDFTRRMEDDLDLIAEGKEKRVDWLSRFYRGSKAENGLPAEEGLHALVTEHLEDIDARDVNSIEIPGAEGVVLRVGRYGPYLERGDERASVPDDMAPDELTAEKAEELLAKPSGDRVLGVDPESGRQVVARDGRYGPYVSEVLEEGVDRQAAHGIALQDDVARDRDAGGRAAAALTAANAERAGRRRDPGRERAVRALHQEGHGDPVARKRGAAVHRHGRRGDGAARAAEGAAGPRPGEAAAEGSGARPGVREADRRQGRAIRPVRDGRRDEREPAPRRRSRGPDDGQGARAPGRAPRQGAGTEEDPPRRPQALTHAADESIIVVRPAAQCARSAGGSATRSPGRRNNGPSGLVVSL